MRYIGIDLHKTLIVACYLENDKYTYKRFKIQEIAKFKSSIDIEDVLCFEATANSAWFYRECINLVKRVVVVDTTQFKVISSSKSKTDKNDAKALAFYLSKDMLPEVRIKDLFLQDLQSLFNSRRLLIKQRTMLKNEIHSLLLIHGIIINANDLRSNKGLDRILSIQINHEISINLQVLINMIKSINEQVKILNKKLEDSGRALPGFNNLSSIDGLGSNTIIMLLATIRNIDDFANYKKLLSYLGTVPVVRNSNETIKHGGITKKGNAALRGNLVQSALVSIKKNNKLNNFYQKLKATKGHGKAIIATVNKLIKIIYFTLKYSWFFTCFAKGEREIRIIN